MGIVNAVTQGDVGRVAMRAGINTVLDQIKGATPGVASANELHRTAVLPLQSAVDAHRGAGVLSLAEVTTLDDAVLRLRGSLPRIGQGAAPPDAATTAIDLLKTVDRSLRRRL